MYQCIGEVNLTDKHVLIGVFEKAGDQIKLHSHKQSHIATLIAGAADFVLWNPVYPAETETHIGGEAPLQVNVPAGWMHSVVSRVPDTIVTCTFDRYDAEGKLIPDPKAAP